MKFHSSRLALVVLTLACPASVFAAASEVTDLLGSSNRPVTRGDFLKASVILLDLSVDMKASMGPYRAYPKELQPYIRVVDKEGAFDVFGARPDLSQPITRGEAVELLFHLRDWNVDVDEVSFGDVPNESSLEDAVELAVDQKWISALRAKMFGVRSPLRGKEARTLLIRASGGTEPQTVKIKVVPRMPGKVDIESSQFRTRVQQLLKDEYFYGDKLRTGSGMTADEYVDSLKDPYTTLLTPDEAKSFRDQLGGTLTGIGAHIELKDGQLFIVSVIDDSPAEDAGLKAGDIVVTIDGKKLEGLTFNAAIDRIRGPEGTTVRVGFLREKERMSVDIVRAVIDIPDTTVETKSNIAIVTISQFGDHLLRDVHNIFTSIVSNNPLGIILDLRDNPGGYLEAGSALVGEFLEKGSVFVRTSGKSMNESIKTTREPSVPSDIPVAVLVNGASASAAEIVAGALRDAGRAELIGTQTFGKGTVQTVYDFTNGASLKFTIAEWLTPNGSPINTVGIPPDIEVQQSETGDDQLTRALDWIRSH